MKSLLNKQTIVIYFLFASLAVFSQETYEKSIEEISFTLEEKAIGGYTTSFSFSREEVRRGWWEYSRKFGTPINMKNYYKVKIPSDYTDGNVDLLIYSKTDASSSGVSFFLGVEEVDFKDQVKSLILDFKKDFHIKLLNKKIATQQKKAIKFSESYQSPVLADERDTILRKIQELEILIAQLREEIKEIVEN